MRAAAGGDVLVHGFGGWAPPFGIVLVADRLAALFPLLLAVLVLFTTWTLRAGPTARRALPLLFLLAFGLSGAFLTGDLFNLFVMFEVVLLASYLLLQVPGGDRSLRAAFPNVAINLVASLLFMVVGTGSVYFLVVALKPIYDAVGIERVNVCTYQAVSGAGRSAVEELVRQATRLLNGLPLEIKGDAKQIAFNAIPHIDVFLDNRYTREEMKMVWETRKIMGDDSIQVNPTAVRVPVFYGHSEAVHIETRDKITADKARDLLAASPGIVVLDEREDGGYPTAVTEGAGRDPVYVGRVREDISHPRGLDLWVVSDNVRKGAALNSIQIAESLVKDHL